MVATLTKGGSDSLVPGVSPQVYAQRDFQRIAALVHSEAGIVLSDGKSMLVYSRIAPLLRKFACPTFKDYLDRAENDPSLKTLTVASLTTNHTYFNRESHHYDHFSQTVRPELVEMAQSRKPVRIWSAACSSGEEIWTLMMTLLGADRVEGRRIAGYDIVALASDLASHAIEAGSRGHYDREAMKAVPEVLRRNWCRDTGSHSEIGDELRAMVRFRQLNLLGSWPFKNLFDVIFCRNVMIYFDHDTKERLVYRLASQLRPGGHLYIGHSERVSGRASDLLESVGPTIYRRRA